MDYKKQCVLLRGFKYVKHNWINNFLSGNDSNSAQNGNKIDSNIPMRPFFDREENDTSNSVTTVPQTENAVMIVSDEGEFYKSNHSCDPAKYDVTATDDMGGGTGSKMLVAEESYLGNVLMTTKLT